MKTLTLALALILGTITTSFAGNHPALTYPMGKFATIGGTVNVTPWAKNVLNYQGGVVVAAAGNGICPVMNHRITSKHNATIALSNGKYMNVCCRPCKDVVEKDLGKFKTYMY